MPVKLKSEEIVTIHVLQDKGLSNCEIARTVGVCEGTVRYHARRKVQGAIDGRRNQPFKAAQHAAVIAEWFRKPEEASLKTTAEVNIRESFVPRFVRRTSRNWRRSEAGLVRKRAIHRERARQRRQAAHRYRTAFG